MSGEVENGCGLMEKSCSDRSEAMRKGACLVIGGKENRSLGNGFYERALRVGRLRVCGRAFLFVLVDSGFGRNQRESSARCGERLRALP